MKKTLLILLALILMFAASWSSKAEEQPAKPEFENIIKVGMDVDAASMDPRLARETTSYRTDELVFDGLVELDKNLSPIPGLAESWESPDDLTWVFKLRKGVKFHDGSDFTAEDVVYTYETEINPDFGAQYRALYSKIQKIEAIDDYTVKMTLSEPYSPLFDYLDLGIVPSEADEIEDFNSKPIGTGPYRFNSWSKNNNIEFVANEDYWGGAPKTEKIVFYIIPDNNTRVNALEALDVDEIHSPLSPMDIDRIKQDSRFTVYETSGLGYTYLGFNHTKGLLKEKDVRVGISYMIDKMTIANDLYQGMDAPAVSPILPVSWAYSDSVTNYEFNPEKGLEVLAAAGWTDTDGDGFLDKDGQKLSVELSTHSEDPNRIQTVEYIQNILIRNGIDAKVSITEWPTFQKLVQISHEHEIALLGWLNLVGPDRAMYNQFHSKGVSNFGGYNNPDLDALLDQARTETDQATRAKLYQQAAQIVNDEVMYNVILYQGYISMYNKNMQGYEPHPKASLKSLRNAVITK